MTREELLSIPRIERQVAGLKESIESLRARATSLSAPLGGSRVQSSGEMDRIGAVVGSIVDMEERMQAEIVRLLELKIEAENVIGSLPEPERTVMRLRYLAGKRWADIAEDLFYSLPHCYELHRRALAEIEFIVNHSINM